jgi:hypothetical protein
LFQWSGIGLAIIGALIYFYPLAIPEAQVIGVIVAFIGILTNAMSSILGREINRSNKYHPLVVTVVSMGAGSIILLAVGLKVEGIPEIDWMGWGIILWLAIVNTAFAFTLWNHTLRTLSAMESSIINGTMLIWIPIFAVIFLGEGISGKEIIGLVAVGIGTLIVQLRRIPKVKGYAANFKLQATRLSRDGTRVRIHFQKVRIKMFGLQLKKKSHPITIGKLFLCSLVYILGVIIGGMILTFMGLQPPPMPEGVDGNRAFLILMLESPLLALTLILIARGLGGGLLSRAVILSFFTWAVYTLNTAIETLAFTTTTVEGAIFTTVSFLPPSILCGTAVAWLFPPADKEIGVVKLVKAYFSSRKTGAWIWRLVAAAVVFVPIYLFFGSLVAPLTAQYFQQSAYGLRMPNQEAMLLVLVVRSALFMLACLPIIIMWQQSKWSLFLNLGIALFVQVGFLYMLGAYYMPLTVRVPHTLEILADSFTYAGLLVVLLAKSTSLVTQTLEARAM